MALLTFITLTAIGGCAALAPHDLTLSQADMQRLIERQFPREQRVLEVLSVISLSR